MKNPEYKRRVYKFRGKWCACGYMFWRWCDSWAEAITAALEPR